MSSAELGAVAETTDSVGPEAVETTPPKDMRAAGASLEITAADQLGPQPLMFLELFAGEGGLHDTLIEMRPGAQAMKCDKKTDGWDLNDDHELAKLTRQIDVGVVWIHLAPPCSTFSRARRNDIHGTCKTLRTEEDVYGFGDEAAEEANSLAKRTFALAELQYKRGGFFSVENPWDSDLDVERGQTRCEAAGRQVIIYHTVRVWRPV